MKKRREMLLEQLNITKIGKLVILLMGFLYILNSQMKYIKMVTLLLLFFFRGGMGGGDCTSQALYVSQTKLNFGYQSLH